MSEKHRVAAAFSAAAASYDRAARAQTRAAAHLAALALALPRPAAPRVLEVGCGTGLLTGRLYAALGGDWLVTDLSPAMVEAARHRAAGARFRVLDAEAPDLGDERFDLIVSNLAAQWFADLGATLAGLAAHLRPGGHLAFSTLGAGSFAQWRAAHAGLGISSGIPAYPEAEKMRAGLPAQTHIEEQRFTLSYADGRAFVRELKDLGAATPVAGHRPLDAGRMRRLLAALGRPAEMDYHVLHLVTKKG